MNTNGKEIRSKEIDISFYIRYLWSRRMIILYFVITGCIIGVFVAFTSTKQYKSEVELLVSTNANSTSVSSLLQQFGGLAGVNIGAMTSSEIIKPDLYPTVLQSNSFLLKFINHPVYFSKYDTTVILEKYYKVFSKKSIFSYVKDYTLGLPNKLRKKQTNKDIFIKNNISDLDAVILTEEQKALFEDLKGRIKVEYFPANEVLKISVEFPDPVASTQLTSYVIQDLTNYIISYKIQKAYDDLEFVRKTYDEAKKKYDDAQSKLAFYRDRNKNVISAISKNDEERLQAEYNLAFNLYNSLSQQLEQAKIRVQEQTPVFKLLGKYEIPTEKSKPKRTIIIFMYCVVAFILALTYIFWQSLIKRFYQSIFKREQEPKN